MQWLVGIAALFVATASFAEVTDASETGFSVTQAVAVDADTVRVWQALTTEISAWWNPELTVSGDRRWLTLDLKPGGCLCERFDNSNGVEHLRVTAVRAPYFLRLSGGLGPLGLMGVSGSMTIELMTVDVGTEIELIYSVGGFSPDGLDSLAAPVDDVMADLLTRLRLHVERVPDE